MIVKELIRLLSAIDQDAEVLSGDPGVVFCDQTNAQNAAHEWDLIRLFEAAP